MIIFNTTLSYIFDSVETRYPRKIAECPVTNDAGLLTWRADQLLLPSQTSYDSYAECAKPYIATLLPDIPLVNHEIVHEAHSIPTHSDWQSLDYVDKAPTQVHESYRRKSILAQSSRQRSSVSTYSYRGYLRQKEKPSMLYTSKANFRARQEFERPIVKLIPNNGTSRQAETSMIVRENNNISLPPVTAAVGDEFMVNVPTETTVILVEDMGLKRKYAGEIDQTTTHSARPEDVFVHTMHPSNQAWSFDPVTNNYLKTIPVLDSNTLDSHNIFTVVQPTMAPDHTNQPNNQWQERQQINLCVDVRMPDSVAEVSIPTEASENILWDEEADLKINKGKRLAMRKARAGKYKFPGYLHTIEHSAMVYEYVDATDFTCYADVIDIEEDITSLSEEQDKTHRVFSRRYSIPAARNFRLTSL